MMKKGKTLLSKQNQAVRITTRANHLCPFHMYHYLKAKLHINVKYSVTVKIVLQAKECTPYGRSEKSITDLTFLYCPHHSPS